jgi:predicted metal-dependent hydrolase
MSVQQIRYGGRNIPFVLTMNSRKRVRIEVLPSGNVQVLAPNGTAVDTVRQIVQGKARWIARQQRYFEQFEPRTTTREYVSGETHLYLGRRYRLKIHAVDEVQEVKLAGSYIHICCEDAQDKDLKRKLLEEWYRGHAERVFLQRLAACLDHKVFGQLTRPPMSIRRMRKRWGSCTGAGRLLLNLDLIRAPRPCIDYVITHELCHLLVPDHSAKFSRLLHRVMPDWRARKDRLEQVLA